MNKEKLMWFFSLIAILFVVAPVTIEAQSQVNKKPIEYKKAIRFLEERLALIKENKKKELIWVLQHPKVFTAGKTYKENEILDKIYNRDLL